MDGGKYMRIIDDTGHPMMSKEEVQIIDDLLDKHKPQHCLEWGSGNSTVYFPKKHPDIKSWLAIEHKKVYLELLNDKLDPNTEIFFTENKDEYVNKVAKDAIHDFIFVDGMFRDECLEAAFVIAQNRKEEGLPWPIILLHDAGRIESATMMNKYKDRVKILSQGEKMLSHGYYAHRGLALFLPED